MLRIIFGSFLALDGVRRLLPRGLLGTMVPAKSIHVSGCKAHSTFIEQEAHYETQWQSAGRNAAGGN
jgi:hypothetical protein